MSDDMDWPSPDHEHVITNADSFLADTTAYKSIGLKPSVASRFIHRARWVILEMRATLLNPPRTEDTKGQGDGVLPNMTPTNADPEQQNEVKP